MPFVRGFLRQWHPKVPDLPDLPHPGRPDVGLPEGGGNGDDDDDHIWGGGVGRPGWGLPGIDVPTLPPKDEWPPLPPWFDERPGQGLPLPIPPRPGAPTVPLPPDPEIDELPEIWPPLPSLPGIPDFSGKTLCLVTIHVSRRVHFVRWMVVDHEEAKSKLKRALEWLKSRMPAGGIAGRPPQRPGG